MLVAFQRISFIAFLLIFTCSGALRQHGTSSKTLYVADEEKQPGGRVAVIDRTATVEADSGSERKKRHTAALDTPPALPSNISTWVSGRILIASNLSPFVVCDSIDEMLNYCLSS